MIVKVNTQVCLSSTSVGLCQPQLTQNDSGHCTWGWQGLLVLFNDIRNFTQSLWSKLHVRRHHSGLSDQAWYYTIPNPERQRTSETKIASC